LIIEYHRLPQPVSRSDKKHRTRLIYFGCCEIDMRLIMLGTGPFAVPTLKALAASSHEVALVVTRPPRGRDPQASPLQRAGESLNLPIWSPSSVNLPESQARLTALNADLLVVCDYGEILKSETLATTRLGGINLHGSLLPKYRGAAPVQTAILRGETETGNSVIQMTPGLDAGPCLGQQRTPIDPDEDAATLETRLAETGAALVLQVVDQLQTGTAQPIAQDQSQASKAPRLTKEQGAIDWSRPATEIKNLVRAVRPWPRAYTFWHRSDGPALRLNIDRTQARAASAARAPHESAAAPIPGTILQTNEHLFVATGDGMLELIELQPAGKRSMSAGEFLRGNRVQVGDRLGSE
jgi:methionyl-tRNA formyltransferase